MSITSWFQCPECHVLIRDTSHFLNHLETHRESGSGNGKFHFDDGPAQEIGSLKDVTIFIPKIHLTPFTDICQKHSIPIVLPTIQLSVLAEGELHARPKRLKSSTKFNPRVLTDESGSEEDFVLEAPKQKRNRSFKNPIPQKVPPPTSIVVDINGKIKLEGDRMDGNLENDITLSNYSSIQPLLSPVYKHHCPFCLPSLPYRQLGPFRKHMRKLHQTELKLKKENGCRGTKCNSCEATCNSAVLFDNYKNLIRTRGGKRNFLCSKCGNGFGSEKKLEEHVQSFHARVPGIEHECSQCHRKYPTLEGLRGHQYTYCNLKRIGMKFICKYCAKEFRTPKSLRAHVETHSQVRQACAICYSTFSVRALLRRHMREIHEPTTPPLLFPCPKCGFKFKRKKYLTEHLRLRHLEK